MTSSPSKIRVVTAPYVLPGAPRASPGRGSEASVILDGALALEGDRIVEVGPRAEVEARHGPGEHVDAVVLPALVNAHLHLELSHLAGRVPGGDGLPGWIERFVLCRSAAATDGVEAAMAAAADALVRAGVAAVGDVTNTLASLPHLARSGMAGTLYHEVFGFSARLANDAMATAAETRARAPRPPPGLRLALSPHAIYSTRPAVVARLLRAGPASIHLAEDSAERELCARGTGPFATIARRLGASDDDLQPGAPSAVAAVGPHLHRETLVVHAVDLDDRDRALLARSGATAVLCPRSNLHIGRALPDLPRLLDAGIPLAIGTDSLASSPSLHPLAELAALRVAFPAIEPMRLVALAWNGSAVGAPAVGRLAPGTAPGVVAAPLEGARPEHAGAWLLDAFGARERRFDWIARHRPEAPAP